MSRAEGRLNIDIGSVAAIAAAAALMVGAYTEFKGESDSEVKDVRPFTMIDRLPDSPRDGKCACSGDAEEQSSSPNQPPAPTGLSQQ